MRGLEVPREVVEALGGGKGPRVIITISERGIAPQPKITPHALRRTYISLTLEAGAPLPYVMDQVGHADSKTTLEIYAQVQKRVSRKNVHAVNGADSGVAPGRL